MAPEKDKRLKIGDWVTVHATVSFDYDNQKRVMNKNKATFDGQIVGGTTKQLGRISGGSGYHYDDYDPAVLHVEKTAFVWLVKRGITNKDNYVLPEDLTYHENYSSELPWKWSNSYKWTEADRKNLAQDVKDAPRNKRGQFAKTGHMSEKSEKILTSVTASGSKDLQ